MDDVTRTEQQSETVSITRDLFEILVYLQELLTNHESQLLQQQGDVYGKSKILDMAIASELFRCRQAYQTLSDGIDNAIVGYENATNS